MRTSLLGDHFLLIIPKSDKVLQYHPWMKGLSYENKANDQQLTIESSWWFYKSSLLGPREWNDYSSKSLHIKYIFLQCILLFFYFFHSILLCLTWYICPSLAWQEESRFSLLVNQVRFISISVLIFHDANFLFWYMSIIQFDLILHISVKFRKSPPAWPFHSHEWPGHNFSLQYQYIIKQTTDQNSEKTIN